MSLAGTRGPTRTYAYLPACPSPRAFTDPFLPLFSPFCSQSDRESSSKVSSRPVTDADMPIDPSSSAHQMLGVGMIAGLNDQPSLPMLPESSADTKNIPALKRPRIDSR